MQLINGLRLTRFLGPLLLLALCGCASPYKLAEGIGTEARVSDISVIDARTDADKLGKKDRRTAIYKLSDVEVSPDRMGLLRRRVADRLGARSKSDTISIVLYDIIIFAGKSEALALPTYGEGLLAGVASALMDSAASKGKLFIDVVTVAIAAEVNGTPVAVYAYRTFEGLRDMPVARKALQEANADALEKFLAEAEAALKANPQSPKPSLRIEVRQ